MFCPRCSRRLSPCWSGPQSELWSPGQQCISNLTFKADALWSCAIFWSAPIPRFSNSRLDSRFCFRQDNVGPSFLVRRRHGIFKSLFLRGRGYRADNKYWRGILHNSFGSSSYKKYRLSTIYNKFLATHHWKKNYLFVSTGISVIICL